MEKPEQNGVTPLVAELISKPAISRKRKEELAVQQRRKEKAYGKLLDYAPEAVDTLVDIMRLGNNSDRLKAAVKVLEYAVGKPAENKNMDELKEKVFTIEEYEEVITDENEETIQLMIEEGYSRGK